MITEKILKVDPEHGLLYTLSEMNRLENLSIQNPKFLKFVHETFSSGCVPCYPGKVWRYMHDNFYYFADEHDETIRAPHVLVDEKKGDCDDFALFAKAVLDMLGGWFTNYMLLARNRGEFTHVVTLAHRGRSLFNLIDPVIIDGASMEFNYIKPEYKFRRIIK